MIIVCQKCSSRLQVDDNKMPASAFSIRCPKCNNSVEVTASNPAMEQSGLAVGESPATGNPRFERPNPAPLFEIDGNETEVKAPETSAAEMLLALLSKVGAQDSSAVRLPEVARPAWNSRKALVCAPEENRETVARSLVQEGYKVFVAHDTRQAVERMRENQLDVVVLDARFDPVEQGPVYITREVSILRPAQRRRLFLVLLSSSLRTMDAHAAFLHNVNMIVNLNEADELPRLLDHRLRQYNELYKEFHQATGVAAL